ncbi:hypothetical protein [Sphingomonas sp. Mn802worker]|uniref:hypothetical protein n=1 Tax=Sphingomonas sp. Mn802worker TaxID=629773 RepID=UPI0003781C19|nr:hypothetical protein [Sphingomonas sp. Mn802worker]
MVQIILALLAIAAAIYAVKVAVLLIVLIGLIFRTRTTVSILMMLGAWALLGRYPVAGIALTALVAFVTIKRALASNGGGDNLPDKPSD